MLFRSPAELSERYQVSKTPVIQALKRMANEGILEITFGGKYIVPVASQKQIQDVCQARLVIEENALTALCRNPEKTDITALKNIEKELAEFYEKGSFDKYFLCDMHFHKKLVELAGNGCMGGADNRLRRKAFYLKNGMVPMDYEVVLFGVEMEVLTFGSELTFEQYHAIYKEVLPRPLAGKIRLRP